MRRSFFALAVAAMPLVAAPASAPAQTTAAAPTLAIDKARIDAALAAMVESGRAAGVSALVWKAGREVYFGTAGLADRDAGKPMRPAPNAQTFLNPTLDPGLPR